MSAIVDAGCARGRSRGCDRLAPLYNTEGKVVFFLGGQINCSTTVHSYTDILRILSTSDDRNEDAEAEERPPPGRPLRSRRGLFRSLWNLHQKDKLDVREAGMEPALLKRIEKMSLGTQMKLFYTAYSKVRWRTNRRRRRRRRSCPPPLARIGWIDRRSR